jgi:serine/threonine protein kinase
MAATDSFDFSAKQKLMNKYIVIKKIGSGWEGEVYLIKERATGILRAAKFFFPRRNKENKTITFHAKKLNKLRECNSIIKYFTQETIDIDGTEITFLVSEFVQGENLRQFIKKQKAQKLEPYQGLHLLYSLAKALEEIHSKKEYHGDLHPSNIMVEKFGLSFKIKIYDMFHWGKVGADKYQQDIIDIIRIFYEAIGGSKTYATSPDYVKSICLGNKSNLIRKKFKTANELRTFLEDIDVSGTTAL